MEPDIKIYTSSIKHIKKNGEEVKYNIKKKYKPRPISFQLYKLRESIKLVDAKDYELRKKIKDLIVDNFEDDKQYEIIPKRWKPAKTQRKNPSQETAKIHLTHNLKKIKRENREKVYNEINSLREGDKLK